MTLLKTLFNLLSLALVFLVSILHAQPAIEWQRCFGGTDEDYARTIVQTNDGGYIFAGSTGSFNGDVWLVKLNGLGVLQWQKCFGGSLRESSNFTHSVLQTSDDGFIFTGITNSNDGNVNGNHGGIDVWVVKLSSAGDIQWKRCLGGTGDDYSSSIIQTNDGGFIITADTYSNDGDVVGKHGLETNSDLWVVKMNQTGDIQWTRCLGGSGSEGIASIQQNSDGGYFLAGFTNSNDGDVSGFHGLADVWVVKINSTGDIQWQKCLGGTEADYGYSGKQTSDGGYIVAGETGSVDGDVAGNHGGIDVWVVKLNSAGGLQWQRCYGGGSSEIPSSIQISSDEGFIFSGATLSNDCDVSGHHGSMDFWVVKLNSTGTIQWQKCLGGSDYDRCYSVHQTKDGGYAIAGETRSNDGDVSGFHGINSNLNDAWVVKLGSVITDPDPFQTIPTCFQVMPNPASCVVQLKAAAAFVGMAYQIFNAQGKAVMIGQISAEEMPLSTEGLPAGIYTILAAGRAARLVKE
jgi:hypothetical protein